MKIAAAANDETEIIEQQQVTIETPAAKAVTEVLEQKHAATTMAITNAETETLGQHAAATATIDGKYQELLTFIGRRRNVDRKRQGPSERHQQEDQTVHQRQQKVEKACKDRQFLKNLKNYERSQASRPHI